MGLWATGMCTSGGRKSKGRTQSGLAAGAEFPPGYKGCICLIPVETGEETMRAQVLVSPFT